MSVIEWAGLALGLVVLVGGPLAAGLYLSPPAWFARILDDPKNGPNRYHPDNWREQLQPPRPRSLHFAGPAMDVNRPAGANHLHAAFRRDVDPHEPIPIHDQVRRDHCPHQQTFLDTALCDPYDTRTCGDCGQEWHEPRHAPDVWSEPTPADAEP